MIPRDLEASRESFLHQLSSDFESFHDYGDFMGYWRAVEAEARHSEDIGQLDSWVKDLRRDRDKLDALKARQHRSESSQLGAAPALMVIQRLLALLDEIEGHLKRRLSMLRDMLGMWVFLAGPGVKQKPAPKGDDAPKGDKDKQTEQVLHKPQVKAKPTKTKGT